MKCVKQFADSILAQAVRYSVEHYQAAGTLEIPEHVLKDFVRDGANAWLGELENERRRLEEYAEYLGRCWRDGQTPKDFSGWRAWRDGEVAKGSWGMGGKGQA